MISSIIHLLIRKPCLLKSKLKPLVSVRGIIVSGHFNLKWI